MEEGTFTPGCEVIGEVVTWSCSLRALLDAEFMPLEDELLDYVLAKRRDNVGVVLLLRRCHWM